MKRKLIMGLTAVLSTMLFLTACGNSGAPSGGSSGSNNATNEEVEAKEGLIKAEDSSKNPSTATDRKDTLVIGIDAPEEVFNPLYAESAYDVYVKNSLFEGMITVDGEGKPVPELAENYEISEDGLTYTFKLKEGLKFSDGSPLTTEDVAFTLTVLADPNYDGVMDIVNATPIKGAKAYKEGKASEIEGIKVVDDKNISITLDKPTASAIYDFGVGILSKAYYGKEYKQGNVDYIKTLHTKPMGAGSYKFVSSKAGQEVVLEANENYFQGKPKIPNLIYKVTSADTRMQMLQTGEIDMDMITVNKDNVDKLATAGFLDMHIFPTNGYGYIGMNHKDKKYMDPKVRQALTYGLNRKEITDAVFTGYADVINVPQSKVSWAYESGKNTYDYNAEKAEELLDEAGWVKGSDGIREKDGEKFTIKFTASTPNEVNEAIIPIAQANFEQIGIKFEAEQMDFNAVRQKVEKGEADMYFMAWGLTADPDPTNVFGTKGAQNRNGYSNTKVDELMEKGLRETDMNKRKEIYKELYTILNEDLPYIFLYQRRDMWAVNSRVKGFDNEITPYKDFTDSLWKLTLE
ncbi:ABC transporter substrate-binding protein [Clostridium tarantellae]|uniref:ABC transporter substrate-binding protein n=1 Tax=Clostridium tarantellae TaxID=39493 RepID=A0A6I1MJZ8_9CLOT|nr:ABC transporter substrate-binding protein [Clostridium tarantellae]MPQ43715.1 ABC transporter substrate-binding protein [Clostridium tarantellae]